MRHLGVVDEKKKEEKAATRRNGGLVGVQHQLNPEHRLSFNIRRFWVLRLSDGFADVCN